MERSGGANMFSVRGKQVCGGGIPLRELVLPSVWGLRMKWAIELKWRNRKETIMAIKVTDISKQRHEASFICPFKICQFWVHFPQQELSVMDDTVLQTHSVNPMLVQIILLSTGKCQWWEYTPFGILQKVVDVLSAVSAVFSPSQCQENITKLHPLIGGETGCNWLLVINFFQDSLILDGVCCYLV